MREAEAVEGMENTFATDWPGLNPTVPFTLVNEQFVGVAKFASVEIRHDSRVQATMGSAPIRKFECRGAIIVTLYAPVDEGRRVLAALADDARTILEGRSITIAGDVLHLHGGATAELPTDGARAISTVTVEFLYYETR